MGAASNRQAPAGVAVGAAEARGGLAPDRVEASAALPEPPPAAPGATWRAALEVGATVVLLTAFCAGGFFGLSWYNHHLQTTGHTYFVPETILDRHIPLRVGWIWIYLSYYPGCFLPVLLLTSLDRFRQISRAYAIQFGCAFLFFWLIPMRMGQPPVVGAGAAEDALRRLYQTDPGYNIFPSLHTANALMIACCFWRMRPGWLARLVWVWAVGIALSTVLVKQHYAADVLGGIALACVADRFALRPPVPDR